MHEINVEYYKIDGKDYIIGKKIEYNGSTYILLVNENDYTDSLVQKEINNNLEPVEDVETLHKILSIMKSNN
jgi:hypothetical protein